MLYNCLRIESFPEEEYTPGLLEIWIVEYKPIYIYIYSRSEGMVLYLSHNFNFLNVSLLTSLAKFYLTSTDDRSFFHHKNPYQM